jgi:hypothetical protein
MGHGVLFFDRATLRTMVLTLEGTPTFSIFLSVLSLLLMSTKFVRLLAGAPPFGPSKVNARLRPSHARRKIVGLTKRFGGAT